MNPNMPRFDEPSIASNRRDERIEAAADRAGYTLDMAADAFVELTEALKKFQRRMAAVNSRLNEADISITLREHLDEINDTIASLKQTALAHIEVDGERAVEDAR